MRWPLLVLLVVAGATVGAVCGGESTSADPIGLAAAIQSEEPTGLPRGVKVEDEFDAFDGSGEDGLVVIFLGTFSGKDTMHDAFVSVFRTERDAENALRVRRDVYEGNGKRAPSGGGAWCAWDDETGEEACSAGAGLAMVETLTYGEDDQEIDEDDAEAAGKSLVEALAKHIEDLAGESEQLDRAPARLMPALLAATPPPTAPDGAAFGTPTLVGDDDLLEQFDRARQARWHTGTGWTLYLMTFASGKDAAAYRDEYLQGLQSARIEADGSICKRPLDGQTWVCVAVADDLAALVVHRNTSSEVDREAARYTSDALKHAKTLRAGRLPRKPRSGGAIPGGSATVGRTPSSTPTPKSTPTPVATPTPTLPPVTAINAGTWTFVMRIGGNTCGGTSPPVGFEFTLEYVFSESGGDELIGAGELFGLNQTQPYRAGFGVFQMTLPILALTLPVSDATTSATATLDVIFTDVDLAVVHYEEDYGNCKILADSIG